MLVPLILAIGGTAAALALSNRKRGASTPKKPDPKRKREPKKPPEPKRKPDPKKPDPATDLPSHKVDLVDNQAQPEPEPAKLRSPKAAAQAMYARAKTLLSQGQGAQLGTKGAPSAFVRDAQRDMRKLETDGIYGPAVRARGKELLGVTFPERTETRAPAPAPKAAPKLAAPKAPPKAAAPPKPAKVAPSAPAQASPTASAQRTPEQAAAALWAHASSLISQGKGAQLGTKGAPSAFVRDAQRDMGGLTNDGIYGPAVRVRGKQLTGRTFPARA